VKEKGRIQRRRDEFRRDSEVEGERRKGTCLWHAASQKGLPFRDGQVAKGRLGLAKKVTRGGGQKNYYALVQQPEETGFTRTAGGKLEGPTGGKVLRVE